MGIISSMHLCLYLRSRMARAILYTLCFLLFAIQVRCTLHIVGLASSLELILVITSFETEELL